MVDGATLDSSSDIAFVKACHRDPKIIIQQLVAVVLVHPLAA